MCMECKEVVRKLKNQIPGAIVECNNDKIIIKTDFAEIITDEENLEESLYKFVSNNGKKLKIIDGKIVYAEFP